MTVDPDDVYASPDLPETTSEVAPDEPVVLEVETAEKLTEPPLVFNPRHENDFEGLLYLGRVEKTFRWSNHTFVIRTLTTDDHLQIGQLISQWRETYAETMSWQTAMVAACTVSVDGQVTAVPIGEDENLLVAKFAWARRQYPWTIDRICSELLKLQERVRETLDDMGKAGGDRSSIPG